MAAIYKHTYIFRFTKLCKTQRVYFQISCPFDFSKSTYSLSRNCLHTV